MQKYRRQLKKYIPNFLTVLRIIFTPIFIFFTCKEQYINAFTLFILLSLSDFFDGYLARKWNVVSRFGQIADPLADKILMITSYILFAYLKYIPVCLCLLVVLRDILILLVVILCSILKIKLQISPIISSKINTVVQLIYILLILACKCFLIKLPFVLLDICSIIVSVFTILSFMEYVKKYYWIKDAFCKLK